MNSIVPKSQQPLESLLPSGTTPPEEGVNLFTLLFAVRKNWYLVVLGVAVFLAAASLHTSRLRRIFEAAATVQLDPQPLMPLGNQTGTEHGPESYWSNQEYFATQHQVIASRKVASEVVRRLGLHRDRAFIDNAPAGTKLPPANMSIEFAAEVLRSRLEVKPVADSRLTRVTYRDANPSRAQSVVAAVVDAYVDQNLDRSLDSANQRAEWLDTQLGKLKTELESQEMDLHDFKKKNNLLSVSFDDQTNMLRAQIQQLNTALTDLKARQERVAARLEVLASIAPEDPAAIPQSELLGDGLLATLRANYIESKEQLDRLTALGKGENHPDVQVATVAVRSLREALVNQLGNIRTGVAADLDAVKRELGGVNRLYETAKSQAMDLNLNEVRFARLRRSKDNTERVFGTVLERSTESDLSKLMPFNNVRVLDRPLLPGSPVLPRTGVNLGLGAMLGLLVGLAFAIGRELLDRTVRDVADAERELGLAAIGSLPDVSTRSARGAHYYGAYGRREGRGKGKSRPPPPGDEAQVAELLVHSHPKSAAAEAARALRTNLLLISPDRPYKTLLVTSAGPAEGKTMIAASIAIAMSQAGQRVCLVDCDLRRPRVHTIFGRNMETGVTVALVEPHRLDESITRTMVPDLDVLPSGPTPPNPADLMHSDAFGRLLEELKSRYDRVVIDSPPACLVTDSVILSSRVDVTLLVVRARKTKREAAQRALRSLSTVGGNLAGFVLNAVVPSGESYAYSYYHPYASSPADGDR